MRNIKNEKIKTQKIIREIVHVPIEIYKHQCLLITRAIQDLIEEHERLQWTQDSTKKIQSFETIKKKQSMIDVHQRRRQVPTRAAYWQETTPAMTSSLWLCRRSQF